MIKYRNPLAKVTIKELKEQIFKKIAEYYPAFDDLKTKFVIFHGIRISKVHDGYSIKVYLTEGFHEKLVEIDNKYILKLLLDSIDTELIVTKDS